MYETVKWMYENKQIDYDIHNFLIKNISRFVPVIKNPQKIHPATQNLLDDQLIVLAHIFFYYFL